MIAWNSHDYKINFIPVEVSLFIAISKRRTLLFFDNDENIFIFFLHQELFSCKFFKIF